MDKEKLPFDDSVLEGYGDFCRKMKVSGATPKGLTVYRNYLKHGMELPDDEVKSIVKRINEKFHIGKLA